MDVVSIIILVVIAAVVVMRLLDNREDKKNGYPPRPVGGFPGNPFSAGAQAKWNADVAEIERRKEDETLDRIAQDQHFTAPPPTPHPANAKPRRETLHHGPHAGKVVYVRPGYARIRIPANAPIDQQHEYKRDYAARFVWRGPASGDYPHIATYYNPDGEITCSRCSERASFKVDTGAETLAIPFCNNHINELAEAL